MHFKPPLDLVTVQVNSLFIIPPIEKVLPLLLYSAVVCFLSSFASILMGKTWCLMTVFVLLFLTVPSFCLQPVIMVLPDHTHFRF